MATQQQSNLSVYRPKQILLIGLGGVGGRVVNRIMASVPEKNRSYVQAVSIDTDVGEIQKLNNIPVENHIVLGDNTTVGGYMKKNPDVKDWMVQGKALDIIKTRNTKNGAKQIRMISRIALRATNDQGDLGKKIESAINKVNAVDGKMQSSGLKVVVVCSVAGGTGAGTVLQVPMYLEDAIRNTYDQSSVEFECAMLMPDAFETTLSYENYINAKVNGYAVIRELMTLNTGKMRRYEYFDVHEVDTTDKRIAPYGRIMLFDNTNGKGEAITGAVNTTHVPLMADALVEYLFGPASTIITSALDNTLKKVYDTDGAGIFGAVGRSALVYPKRLYQQYAVSNWVKSSISKTWLSADEMVEKSFNEEVRQARKNGRTAPDEKRKYELYTEIINEKSKGNTKSLFFLDIKNQLLEKSEDEDEPMELRERLANIYWSSVCNELLSKLIYNNKEILSASNSTNLLASFTYRNREGLDTAKKGFTKYYIALNGLRSKVNFYAREFMCPTEANNPSFYKEDDKETHLNCFIKKYNFHPVALRGFLYELYEIMQKNISKTEIENPELNTVESWDKMLEKKNGRATQVGNYRNRMQNSAVAVLKSDLAKAMLIYLEEMIKEVEDLFISVKKVEAFFDNDAKKTLDGIEKLAKAPDTVVAGSALSAINCWNTLEGIIHGGEEGAEVIDNELSKKLNEMIYRGYYKHVDSKTVASTKKSNYDFRIPTDYNTILVNELQRHFYDMVSITYRSVFPENIVEAVKYDCGVKNYWNILNDQSVVEIPAEELFCENPYDEDLCKMAEDKNLPAFEVVGSLSNLLSFALSKSEPRCGRVNIVSGGHSNKYMIMSRSILAQVSDQSNIDNGGVSEITTDESAIITGVPTNSIMGEHVNACFDGKSENVITFVSVHAALEPSDFLGFLAPTSDEDDPQDSMNYYREYRKYMNKVAADPKMITPHLDRNWHIGGKLIDITKEHTVSSWRYAAKAFVYGFIYNTIRIDADGTVIFGEYGNKNFFGISHTGEREEEFITTEQKADVSGSKMTFAEKTDINNYILYKIFEKLMSYDNLTTAIINDAEERLYEEVKSGQKEFIKKALEDESVANMSYNCILDVIDGYYKGASNVRFNQKDYIDETTTYMFEILITKIFNQVKDGTQSLAKIREVSKKTLEILYRKAICDEIVKPEPVTAASAEGEADDYEAQLELLLGSLDSDAADSQSNPFSEKGRFSKERAMNLIDLLLRKSEI